MSLLLIENLSLRIAGRPLLENASLAVDPGRRIGLVGRNGAGKTTLLKAIAGTLQPDGGTIRLASRARLGQVSQEAPSGNQSLLETVLAADLVRTALLVEAETADPLHMAEVHERLRAIDADSAPARAATILAGLGFGESVQARPVNDFSGGWRMRVALASALFQNPDLLLLDEPTNHLDLEATLWLETWLERFPGAALIVSHDQGILDRAVESIAHLDRGKIVLTTGGYSEFVRLRTERAAQLKSQAARVAEERDRIQSFVDRFRAKATKARQAQSRLKALAKLPVIDTIIEDSPTRFSFPEPPRLAPPILAFDKVAVGYENTPILRGLSLSVDPDDRIALLGANGNGKSTLAKLIAGRLAPLSGTMRRASKLAVGYFAQHQSEELVLTESPIAHMQRALPESPPAKVRAQLARFGLDADRANTKVSDLSGGEKARLLLALATRDAPHLLVLDEPTNHLDIDAREALVRALSAYTGAVLLISHDPHLVELIADRLWLVADNTVKDYEGDLDDYRNWLSARARPSRDPNSNRPRTQPRPASTGPRTALAPLQKIVKETETRLAKLTAERNGLEKKLADPAIYRAPQTTEVTAAQTRLAAIARELEEAENAWLEAETALSEAS